MIAMIVFFMIFLSYLEAIVICCLIIMIMSNKTTPSENLGH